MNPLMITAPIFAVLLSLAALVAGAAWWVVLGSLLLSAPAIVLLTHVICTTVYRCAPDARD